MVHPLMRQTPPPHQAVDAATSSHEKDPETDAEHVASRIIDDMLPRLHVLVVGPGLGRDRLMQAVVTRVVRAAREKGMPLVIDADGLQIVQKDPKIVEGYKEVILTPNVVEFERLCKALGIEPGSGQSETGRVEALARVLKGVTVIEKGRKDFISNGDVTLEDDLEGGKKRSGGQGDTLTGALATFLAWRKAYLDGLWDVGEEKLSAEELMGLAAFGGSAITRVSRRPNTTKPPFL
jgi:ATP-dependent NAD(P)H-hydrate dehydratase